MSIKGDPDQQIRYADKPEGPIAAAMLAVGVGAAALGVLTTLAEAIPKVKELLTWSDAVGPLSGKTIGAVVVWLVAWLVLHLWMRTSARESRREFAIALILIGVGVLGTFPTFFQLFG